MRIFLCLWGVMLGTSAWGMECPFSTLPERVNAAEVVFVGTVAGRSFLEGVESKGRCWTQKNGPECGPKVAHLKVEKIWKGTVGKNAVVYSEDGCYCTGSYLKPGQTYIIFAARHEALARYGAEYGTLHCGGTMGAGDDNGDTAYRLNRMLPQ